MANKNRIRFARSITRDNLPATLEYGEPGYIKNNRLIIGNEDGSEFVVNDWNNLRNKPNIAGEERTLSLIADEAIQVNRAVRIKPSNGRVVRASKTSATNSRVIGIAVTAASAANDTIQVQIEGTIDDPSWTWTPGDEIYLANTVGGFTNDISAFADTDMRTFIGIALSATSIVLYIQKPETLDEAKDIVQSITDGDTTGVPSADAVYDHVSGAIAAIALPPDLTTEVSTLEARVDNIYAVTDSGDESGLIVDLEDRMDTVETDITTVTNIVNTRVVQTVTNGDTTHVPSSDAIYDHVASEIGILETRVEDNESDITTLNTDVSTLTTDLGTTITQVNTNTSNISNIATVVNGQIVQTVTDGDTAHAPSADAVYDHVAYEVDIIDQTITALETDVDDNILRLNNLYIVSDSGDTSGLVATISTDLADLTDTVSDLIVQTVTNSDTTHAPSGDAIYNFVQTEISNITPVQSVTNGDTTNAPSADAVYDFVFNNVVPYSGSTRTAGKFYSGTTDPVSDNRINFDGNLHVNDLHTNAASIYIGETKISTETGTLIYKPDSQIEQDYEVVLTQLTGTLGPAPQTHIGGEVFIDEGLLKLNQKQIGSAAPSRNALFEVERGAENNTAIRWNETNDRWEASSDGTTFLPIVLADIDGKISASNLPSSVVNALKYRGMWPASGGIWPANPDTGSYYIISSNGTIEGNELQSGDWIVYNGTWWDKIDNTDRVSSVAGKTGNVTLTSADVGLQNVVNARSIQSPATSTPNRLIQWNDATGDTVKTAPASISDIGELTLHNHQAKIIVDRTGIGQNQSIGWNEGTQFFVSSAPFTAPNLPQMFQSNGLITTSKQQFLLVHEAQSVQFEIIISDRFSNIVRSETVNTVLSNGDLKWSSVTHAKVGDSNAIKATIAQDGVSTVLGFEVQSGSWYIVVRVNPMPFWNGLPITYSMGIA